MTPERRRQIEALYDAAAAQPVSERAAWLVEVCGNDTELLRDVTSLLAQHASTDATHHSGAGSTRGGAARGGGVSIRPGRRMGAYEIVTQIGAGGMGEVYLARDTRLGRDVAVKVLPHALSQPDRLVRFEREARALASLNHPNIATIHGVEESQGVKALVLELVPGETLAEKIERARTSGVPIPEALAIARQIAHALDAAHQKGIVHRDLKPSNLKIAPTGMVKVLDFGLAKLVADHPGGSRGPTMSIEGTGEGLIVGTPAYMSPEQARGQTIDKRTDIWAFGCVLYEMLTGRAAFARGTLTDTLASVLEHEPEWRALPSTTPHALRELIQGCLVKNAAARLHDAGAIAQTIESLIHRPSGANARWKIAAIILAIGIGGVASWRYVVQPEPRPTRFEFQRLTNFPDAVHSPALSPDGTILAFVRGRDPFLFGAGELYVKVLPDGQPIALTEDGQPKMAPAFTPAGDRIVFTTADFSSSSVPVGGGAPTSFMPNASGLKWIGSDRLLFSEMRQPPNMGVVTATMNRGQSRDVYVPRSPQGMAHFSELSPDGKWVLVVEMDTSAWMPCRMVPFDGSSNGTRVGPEGAECTAAAWSRDGRWMYFAAGVNNESHLWRQEFPDGEPEQLTSGPEQARGVVVEPDGQSLITTVGQAQSVVWYHDETGDRPVSVEGYAYRPLVSPDGEKVFYLVRRAAKRSFSIGELWALDLASGKNERLLSEFLIRSYDISSDGRTVVFDTFDGMDRSRIWIAFTDGSGSPRKLTDEGPADEQRPFFGTTGAIYFMRETGRQLPSLFRMKADGSARQPLAEDVTFLVSISPDERWAAVWSPRGTSLISLVGEGTRPLCSCSTGPIFPDSPRVKWSADGKSLFVNLGYATDPGGGTVVLPWPDAITALNGMSSAPSDLPKRPGARLVHESSVAPGRSEQRYAFARQAEQSNIYRIRLR